MLNKVTNGRKIPFDSSGKYRVQTIGLFGRCNYVMHNIAT